MIPKINAQGHSFKSIINYLIHDKEAQTSERLEWSETGNMLTDDLEKAAKVMAWTDKNADFLKEQAGGAAVGRKTEKGAVYHYSISWDKSEEPDQSHQRDQAISTIEKLGLQDHEYVMVSHNDTKHAHVHIVVNLTNPENGKRAELGLDRNKLQKWALEYEREHGIFCRVREEKAKQLEHSNQKKQDYTREVTRAFELSDNGASFRNALKEEGLDLCPARRGGGFVVVDQSGDIQQITRFLSPVNKYGEEIKNKAKGNLIKERLKDLNREELPDADELAAQYKNAHTLDEEEKTKLQLSAREEFAKTAQKVADHKSFDSDQKEPKNEISLEIGSIVKALDRGNYGTILEQSENGAYIVQFTNNKTQKTFVGAFKPEDIELVHKPKLASTEPADGTKKRWLSQEEFQQRYALRQRIIKQEIQKRIDLEVSKCRQKWEIDRFVENRDAAAQDLADKAGFWARITGRRQEAADHLEATQKTLEERLWRFEHDIEAAYAARSFILEKEQLEQHLFQRQEQLYDPEKTIWQESDELGDSKKYQEISAEALNVDIVEDQIPLNAEALEQLRYKEREAAFLAEMEAQRAEELEEPLDYELGDSDRPLTYEEQEQYFLGRMQKERELDNDQGLQY